MIEYRIVQCHRCGYRSVENRMFLSKKEGDISRCPKCGSSSLEIRDRKI